MKNPLQLVATGLAFLLAGAVVPVLLAAPAVALFAARLLAPPAAPSGGDLLPALLAVAFTGLGVSALLGALGSFLCLAVPPESRCSEAAVAMLLLHALGLVLAAARSVAAFGAGPAAGPDALEWLGVGLWLLEQVAFFVFLYRLGVYLDRGDVRRGVWAVPGMVLGTVALFGLLLLFARGLGGRSDHFGRLLAMHLLMLPPPFHDKPGLLLALLFCGAAAVTYWKYLALLWRARGACAEASE